MIYIRATYKKLGNVLRRNQQTGGQSQEQGMMKTERHALIDKRFTHSIDPGDAQNTATCSLGRPCICPQSFRIFLDQRINVRHEQTGSSF